MQIWVSIKRSQNVNLKWSIIVMAELNFFSHLKDCHFRLTIFYHFCYFILNHKPSEFKRNKLDFVKILLARCFTLDIIIIVSSRYCSLQNFGLKIVHLNFKWWFYASKLLSSPSNVDLGSSPFDEIFVTIIIFYIPVCLKNSQEN